MPKHIPSGSFDWTDERCDELRRGVADGLPYSVIGRGLGISRNAAIGKARRLGITNGRPQGHQPVEPARKEARGLSGGITSALRARRRLVKNQVMDVQEPQPMQPAVAPLSKPCTLLDLTEETCRWPLGDPGQPDFHFCGGKSVEGLPYCAFHSRLAYQPANARRDRAA